MPKENQGIDHIKATFKEVIKLSTSIAAVLEDGKVNIIELPGLAIAASKIPRLVEAAKNSLAQFKDLSTAESREVAGYIQTEFSIDNKKLEAHIEQGIFLLSDTYDFTMKGIELVDQWEGFVTGFKKLKAA